MLAASRFQYLYLAYLSKPQSDRALYKAIHRQRWHRMLEIGVGRGVRARRLIDVAARHHARDAIRYVGIDLFEGRTAPAGGMSLKESHRFFKSQGVAAQLIPGDPFAALSRAANSLREMDLVLIAADQHGEALERAWFYLPRMLHPTSMVYLEQTNAESGVTLIPLRCDEVEARARRPHKRAA